MIEFLLFSFINVEKEILNLQKESQKDKERWGASLVFIVITDYIKIENEKCYFEIYAIIITKGSAVC